MTQGRDHQASPAIPRRLPHALAGVRPLRVLGLSALLLLGIAGFVFWQLWPPVPVDPTGRAERARLMEVAEERAMRGWGLEPCPGYEGGGFPWQFEGVGDFGVPSPEVAVLIQPSWSPKRLVLINRSGTHAFEVREGADAPSVVAILYAGNRELWHVGGERQLLDAAWAGDADANRRLISLMERRYDIRNLRSGDQIAASSFEPVADNPLPMLEADALIDTLRRHIVFPSSFERRGYDGTAYLFLTRQGSCALAWSPDDETPAGSIARMMWEAAQGRLDPERVREEVAIIEAFDGARAPDWRDQLAALWAGFVGAEPAGETQ